MGEKIACIGNIYYFNQYMRKKGCEFISRNRAVKGYTEYVLVCQEKEVYGQGFTSYIVLENAYGKFWFKLVELVEEEISRNRI